MQRILDHKPDPEAVVVNRINSFVTQALENDFPHLRRRESFGSDEATIVTSATHEDGGKKDISHRGGFATPHTGRNPRPPKPRHTKRRPWQQYQSPASVPRPHLMVVLAALALFTLLLLWWRLKH